jgi:glutathione peroxidase
LYRYLTAQKPGPKGREIAWNFTKFLVDRNGQVVERFEPAVSPAELALSVRKLLG